MLEKIYYGETVSGMFTALYNDVHNIPNPEGKVDVYTLQDVKKLISSDPEYAYGTLVSGEWMGVDVDEGAPIDSAFQKKAEELKQAIEIRSGYGDKRYFAWVMPRNSISGPTPRCVVDSKEVYCDSFTEFTKAVFKGTDTKTIEPTSLDNEWTWCDLVRVAGPNLRIVNKDDHTLFNGYKDIDQDGALWEEISKLADTKQKTIILSYITPGWDRVYKWVVTPRKLDDIPSKDLTLEMAINKVAEKKKEWFNAQQELARIVENEINNRMKSSLKQKS